MFRIDSSTAVGVLPAPLAAGAPGYFNHAAPGSGEIPTVLTSDWCNGIQEELMSILAYAGIAADKTDHDQVLEAILSIVGGAAVVGAGAIFGLTLSNAPAAPTTKVSISAGLTRDGANSASMVLAAPITKDLTAAWAPGSGAGGRDAGALANGQTWHVFLILKPADGTIDALFSQSPTAPTLPAGFTKFRRLGAVVLDASATTIRPFVQSGDWFKYKTRSLDYANAANGAGVPYLRSLAVPVGIKVEAELYFQSTGTNDTGTYLSGVFDPDFGVPPAYGPSTQWAQLRRSTRYTRIPAGDQWISYESTLVRQFTDTSGRVYSFSNDNADVILLGVLGWRDERGKFF